MNIVGKYSRALASAAVMGVAVVGPVALAGPAGAAPGSQGQGAGQGQEKAEGSSHGKVPGTAHGQGRGNGHGHPQDRGGGRSQGQANGHQANGHQANGDGPSNPGRGQGAGQGHAPTTPPGSASGKPSGEGSGQVSGQGSAGGPGHGAAAGRDGGRDHDPAGNNGTVKIETSGDADGIPNNVPHVGCDFQVEWYGFDEGDDIVSTVLFTPHAPTADVVIGGAEPSRVFVGGDPASGAGTDTGLDGVQRYHLTFDGEPHPKQGYHVKLTIHTPGSIGADTKHKVFWVQPCETTPPGQEQPPGGEQEETPPGDTEVLGEQDEAAEQEDQDVEVLGKQANRDQATAVAAGLDTGLGLVTSPLALLVSLLGLLLVAAGWAVRRRGA